MPANVDTRAHFKTRWHHRRPAYWLRKDPPRAAGRRAAPEVVRFEPEPGVAPSRKPPVRIFLGTEPMQARAERVFLWSVKERRDPARVYEVHLMKDLAGFDRTGWTTGFTNYRYAIPALAGGAGRAIYNDVDQIYLADPAEMFDLEMGGAGVLCVDEGETSVALIDCAAMAPHWRIEQARNQPKRRRFLEAMTGAGLWRRLPPEWNARDHEFSAARSKCFHFTSLRLQPWRPFPEQFRYEDHPDGETWLALERAANAARFNAFSRARPSAGFKGEAISAAALAGLPEDDVPWALDELFAAAASSCVDVSVDCDDVRTAGALGAGWWRLQLELAAARTPGRRWTLEARGPNGRKVAARDVAERAGAA